LENKSSVGFAMDDPCPSFYIFINEFFRHYHCIVWHQHF